MGLKVEEADGPATGGAYDVIVCEGAVAQVPQTWPDALAQGGRLAVIERHGPVGKARLYLRSQDDVGARTLFDATAPYLSGHEPRKSFAF
jgi:protein-L-isoaspartate(D-aspartate) O-methyltransferase